MYLYMPCLLIRKVRHIETAVILFLMCRNTLLSLFIFTLSVCESNNTIISPSRLLRSHNHAKYLYVFSTRYKMISNQLVVYVLIELQKKHQGSRLKNLIKPGMCRDLQYNLVTIPMLPTLSSLSCNNGSKQ